MSIDFNGKIGDSAPITKNEGTNPSKSLDEIIKKSSIIDLKQQRGNPATKKITDKNIETAVNESSSRKALKGLLENSPIGLTEFPSCDDIEKMGYSFSGTAYHPGAPRLFDSSDGGRVTVYIGGGTAAMGEDKKKVVYTNGRYTQEMYYDENGKLTGGKIIIKDKVAGFTEQQYDFTVKDNNIDAVIK